MFLFSKDGPCSYFTHNFVLLTIKGFIQIEVIKMRKLSILLIVFLMTSSVGCASQPQNNTDNQISAPPQQQGQQPPSSDIPTSSATPPSNSNSSQIDINAAYKLSSGSATLSDKTFEANSDDTSAIYVTNSGSLKLNNAEVITTGNTSSQDESSFYGLNAAVIASNGGTIEMNGGSIKTTGTGANGAFSYGQGSMVTLSVVTINTTADGAHAVMATGGGTMNLNNIKLITAGTSSGAIATDRGGGTINATNVTVETSGMNSPTIYSTGNITVKNSQLNSTGSESAVIEGANTINLVNCTLASSKDEKWGVMIYQSMSGDSEGTKGVFTMTDGSLSYTGSDGPLFYVTNSTGIITLKNVNITVNSGILIKAAGNDQWGKKGSNGGNVQFTADAQTLKGDIIADNISTIEIVLKNDSTLTGAINSSDTAKSISLTLDSSSKWNVTQDSYVTTLSGVNISNNTVENIVGNGYTLYYDSTSCPQLGGKTYPLSGGGQLTPKK